MMMMLRLLLYVSIQEEAAYASEQIWHQISELKKLNR